MEEQQLLLDLGPAVASPSNSGYRRHRSSAAQRQAELSAEGRDIGEIPEVANPARRESCRKDLKKFCETYFPKIFYLPWAPMQLETINRLQAAAVSGGQFAIAMPRGTGKSVFCERAAIWAAVYGYRRFIVVVGATGDAAKESFRAIKAPFETNEDFMADFPEICYPVKALEGITNRSRGQTWRGERTHIVWKDATMIFPCIGDSPTGGTIITSASMNSRIRGMSHTPAQGGKLRPDFVLIDDPQTRESAKSVTQIKERKNFINSDILGLAGPGKKITAVMPCTVIQPNDLADQLLDREQNPAWNGRRFKLLEGFPENMHLWQRYWELRSQGLRNDQGTETATRFYIANRDDMDAGCKSTWPERFEHDEISGIQNAMNIFFADRTRFFSEFQNDPEAMELGDGEQITANMIIDRMNSRPKMEIPQAASRLTCFVDVQKNLLYWTIVAFDDHFTGWLIDYGAYPDQPRQMFTTRNAAPTYRDVYPGAGQEGALMAALRDLLPPMLEKSYPREDGAELTIDRCLIDSGWGDSADTIYTFIRESRLNAVIMPSKGVGINATMTPFSEFKRRPGEIISPYEWHIAPIKNKRQVRLLRYDTNYWKSFYRNRVLTSRGDPGAFSINGERITDRFRLLADQLSSEYSIAESARGRRVDVWKLTPNRENHWLDCVIGCMVAASEQGCRLIIDPPTAIGKEPAKPSPAPSPQSPRPKVFSVGKRYGVGKVYSHS
ncbi:MAG: hypothetical protein GX937_02400 [Lentisphaerae bacterium]|jgi:hypothetical protein|nr:hypothetical protein [Lentisphaerota bacterium]